MHATSEQIEENGLTRQIENLCHNYCRKHGITGFAASVIFGKGDLSRSHVMTIGTASKKAHIPITQYTEFRIGPLTQLFTASMLAYFVESGQVTLSDPLSLFVSKSTVTPDYHGCEITLGSLATHTSGLPGMPYALSGGSPFRIRQMYQFFSSYQLQVEPGKQWEFSYFGYAVLTHLLSRIGKQSFQHLMDQVILHPLGLKETTFFLSSEQAKRRAIGYERGCTICPMEIEKMYKNFLGAGGLYATIEDLSTFLSFQMGRQKTSLNGILPLMQKTPRLVALAPSGLGWNLTSFPIKKSPFLYLGGSLFGFSSYMGMLPHEEIGIVCVCNEGHVILEELALEILQLCMQPSSRRGVNKPFSQLFAL